ncbi:BEM_collapsed_G0010490.mRNA.1.CDS.1 [Saccharomyces cerevisiae]|nr:BEM_HP_G0059500.mRNA.1.CDS.1 [Saccharomyces cerevisiae]CAI6970874.1 BEM_HP_G0059500.mRNA.1.CDS.1 [Saccharomyces cerevisiae]CAI7073560.1 BEM_collapsed_G0010490.mRNA.1.CDS.1 [Saccharomyces cerevisiae]
MSHNNRHKKNNDKDSSAGQYANSIDNSLSQESVSTNGVTRMANLKADECGSGGEGDKTKRFSISSILSKRETKDVLPEFAGSSSHNGVLTANSSKDMNFTLELSENLLVECRKLQSSNEAKNEQIKSLKQIKESLSDKIEELTNQKKSFMKELDSTKDLNWDLESKLTNLSMECRQLKELKKKTEKSWNDEKESLKLLKTDLEILTLTKNGMENDLSSQKLHYDKEISELKERILDLNNENDRLLISVSDLTSEINSLQSNRTERIKIQKQLDDAKASISSLKRKVQKKYYQKQHTSDTTVTSDPDSEGTTSEEDIFDIVIEIDHMIETSPSVEDISEDLVKKYSEKNNMILLSNDSYKNLLQKSESASKPKDDELMTKEVAENLNMIALPNDDNYSKKEFSLESHIKYLEASGYKVLPLEEFENLNESLSNPSYNYLKEKLQALKKIPIDQSTFNLLKEPTIDFLLPLTSKIDCLIIPTKDYNDLFESVKNPSIEQMKKCLEAKNDLQSNICKWLEERNGCKWLSNDLYFSMVNKIETPSKQYLSDKAKEYDQVLIDTKALEGLKNPTIDFLREKASASDYLLLKKEDYVSPSLAYLVEHAKATNHHLLSDSAYEELVKCKENPDVEFLKEKSAELGHTVVSNEAYSELEKKLEQPSLAYLVEHAKATNHHLLSDSAYEELVKCKENPDVEFLKEKSAELGHTVVSSEEYSELQRKYSELEKEVEQPSLAYLVEHAKATNHHLLSDSAYEELVKCKENPDVEFLKEKSAKLGHTVVSNEAYSELEKKLEQPSLAYLVEHAKATNHHLLSDSAYEELVKCKENPDVEFLKEKSAKLGHTVVSNEAYSELQRKYSELEKKLEQPSLAYLVEHAKATNHHLLSDSAYEELVKCKENPDVEFLKEKSAELGHTVVSNEAYSELEKKLEQPSMEYLVKHAEQIQSKIISISDFNTLANPSMEDMASKLQKLEYQIVPNDEYIALKNTMEKPDVELLRSKLKGYHIIDTTTYNELVSNFNSPTLKFIEEKAKSKGYRLIEPNEYLDLNRIATTPSKEEIDNFCKQIGCYALDSKEYERLKNSLQNPSKKFIEENAALLDLVLVDKTEYQAMKDNASNKKSLIPSTKALDFVAMPAPQLASAEKSSLQKRTLSDIENELKALGYVAIHKENLPNLEKPIVDNASKNDVLNLCSKFSLVPLSTEEYDNMRKEHTKILNILGDPSIDFLKEKCEKYQMLIISKHDYEEKQEAIENPGYEFILEKASALGYELVSEVELDRMKQMIDSPDIDYMQEKAARNEMVLLRNEEKEALQKKIEYPSLTFLIEKAAGMNKILVDQIEYDETIRKCNHPTRMELEESCHHLNLVLLDQNEYSTLREPLENRNVEDLINTLSKLNYIAIPNTIYQDLIGKYENPNFDYLKDSLNKMDYVAISRQDYELMVAKYEKPQLDYLKISSEKIDHTVVPLSEYNLMVTNYRNPSLSYLKEKAVLNNHILIKEDDYRNILAVSEHPTVIHLSEKASLLNKVLVDKDDFATMSRSIEKPTIDFLSTKALSMGKILVNESTHKRNEKLLSEPDSEFLTMKAKEQGLIIISEKEYSELRDQIDRPSLDVLKKKAAIFDSIIVENIEYQQLVNTTSPCPPITYEDLKVYAHQFGMELCLQKPNKLSGAERAERIDEQSINTTSSNSTTTSSMFTDALDDNIEELNRVELQNNEDYTDIISKSSTVKDATIFIPAYENIKNSAEKLGYKLVPFEKSNINLKNIEAPLFSKDNDDTSVASSIDLDHLSRKAEKYGMTLISDQEFEEYHILKDNAVNLNGGMEEMNNPLSENQNLAAKTTNTAQEGAFQNTVPHNDMDNEEVEYGPDDPTFTVRQLKKPAGDRNLILTSREKTLLSRDDNIMSQNEAVYGDDISDSFVDESQEIKNDVDIIKTQAMKYGMLCIPESNFVGASYASAQDMSDIVVLSASYYHNLMSPEDMKWNCVSNEELQAEVKKRGLQIALTTKEDKKGQATASKHEYVSHKLNNKTSTVSTKSGAKKGLAEAAATTAYEDSESHPQIEEQSHRTNHHKHHKRQQSLNSNSTSKTTRSSRNTPASRRDIVASFMSRAGSASRTASLQTLASLNEPSIIPALTQTVIGEYLFKYYPRLGPFGFESRHERFFWVHPYTLTLYWSASNPILENPANTKTKGVAILGVESVTDPNPYPTGLYHKSIVVTTETRTIKFTCPTRQRHNIWYNSLRYLLQRNMQGISLEDIADDPTDNMYSGKIFPLPGENTKSSSKRLSASRRSVSTRSLRHRVPQSRSFGNLR